MFVCPHKFVHPLYVHTPPGGVHSLGGPMFLCSCMVLAHCMLWGGCFSVLCVLGHTTPIWGCLPLIYTPHTLLLVLCALLFSGISVLMWAFSPSIEGFGGVPPITGGGWGDTSVAVHMLILLHLFCSALCLMSQPQLQLLLLQLQWYLLACHQCCQYQWLLL